MHPLEQVEIAGVSGIDQTSAGEVVYKVTETRKEEFEGMQVEEDARKAAGEGVAGKEGADDAGLALIGALLGLGADEPEEDPEDNDD